MNKKQRQKLMREKGIYTHTINEWSTQFQVSERTIDRDFVDIITHDISRINRENTIYRLLYKLREIEKECRRMSNTTSERTRVSLLRLRTDLCKQILDILQNTGVVDKPPEKIDLSMKEEILSIVKSKDGKKKIVITDEDLK